MLLLLLELRSKWKPVEMCILIPNKIVRSGKYSYAYV